MTILAIATVALAVAFVLGRYFARARPGDAGDVELARLQERERLLGTQIVTLEAEVQTLRDNYQVRSGELSAAREKSAAELAAATERESGLRRQVADRDAQLAGQQEQLKTEFENMANRILSATAIDLSAKSQESLATILDPLKNQIAQFQQRAETTHTEETQQRATIAEQIKQVALAGQSIGAQAENLTNALKGDSQLRGRWGEVRLERILEQAGLARGREFVAQGGEFNLRGEEGGSLRPDVIVLLPENRHLVIDSKLSLVHYLEYESAADDESRAAALKKLIASVRGHADSLAAKRYQAADGLNAHELVLMFVPIEGVAALVSGDELYAYCWSRHVVMVSPSTLFMTMQTVASIWRYERQNENALVIAQQAGLLFDKLAGFVTDLNEVSQRLQSASDAHGEAMKKLSTGRGNALSRAQRLKSLGVSSKKELPVVLVGTDKHVVDPEDDEASVTPFENAEPRRLEKSSDEAA